MRHKELRIALVCYGGISLAVYMHGVTKELWKLARASRNFHGARAPDNGSESVYRRLLQEIEHRHGLKLRVLIDIVAGASAGGINGVFLAQAIHSGQSLEPLTQLWLDRADVDRLLDPEARRWTSFAKFWAVPIVRYLLTRPGNVVSASVAKETRKEVRGKLSRLIRSRWFEPPFSGIGFSRVLAEAFDAMAGGEGGAPLLPHGHPLDLFVTATDFKGHVQTLRLHSPALVEESEHRISIGFRSETPDMGGTGLADPLELVFAARATASFPGAFPPLRLAEIDRLAGERKAAWTSRSAFVDRIMPEHARRAESEAVSLIDGSVLVNAPFAEAMAVLADRPAQREVDRRFVYIDPKPDEVGGVHRDDPHLPGFFSVIFGSLSSIPREQPIRDNLEELAGQSHEMERLRTIVGALKPEVEEVVEQAFGGTFMLSRPTVKRLAAWRNKAQTEAGHRAGYAFHGYAQVKFAGILDEIAAQVLSAAPSLGMSGPEPVVRALEMHLRASGLDHLSLPKGGATAAAISFFRSHDLQHRVRRLRLLARRLSQDWEAMEGVDERARDAARDAVYRALAIYFNREAPARLGAKFADLASQVIADPGAVLEHIAAHRDLRGADHEADTILAEALARMPPLLRRKILLAYLGFPFYDTVTLPLLRGEGWSEFDPAKVDRISPDDCSTIRKGGATATLRGVEFYNFGAFFSRAYRENDYLWGRLHGAERTIDLIVSALPDQNMLDRTTIDRFTHDALAAVLDEEEERLTADPGLIAGLRAELVAATSV